MGVFEQMGFTDPGERIIKDSLNNLDKCGDVVSGFFFIQLVNTVVNGGLNVYVANNLSKESLKYMEERRQTQARLSKERNKAEIDFLKEYHNLCLSYQLETSRIIFENRRKEKEFDHFCNYIWKPMFRPTIDALMKEHNIFQNSNNTMKMKVMIARTPFIEASCPGSMNLEGNYNDFCKNFGFDYVRGTGLPTSWLAAWKKTSRSICAETMNMFYIMQGIPCVLLFPYEENDHIIIESSVWGLSVGLGNLVMEKSMVMSKNEVKNDPSLLQEALLSVCIYASDCYRTLLCQKDPTGVINASFLLNKNSYVSSWLRNKYDLLCSLIQEKNISLDDDNVKKIKKYL